MDTRRRFGRAIVTLRLRYRDGVITEAWMRGALAIHAGATSTVCRCATRDRRAPVVVSSRRAGTTDGRTRAHEGRLPVALCRGGAASRDTKREGTATVDAAARNAVLAAATRLADAACSAIAVDLAFRRGRGRSTAQGRHLEHAGEGEAAWLRALSSGPTGDRRVGRRPV